MLECKEKQFSPTLYRLKVIWQHAKMLLEQFHTSPILASILKYPDSFVFNPLDRYMPGSSCVISLAGSNVSASLDVHAGFIKIVCLSSVYGEDRLI